MGARSARDDLSVVVGGLRSKRQLGTPSVLYLGTSDRKRLRRFRCSRGAWFEDEVQDFIQGHLISTHETQRAHADHTVMALELPGQGLVAVGSHYEDLRVRGDDDIVTATFLEVAAVALRFQGVHLRGVEVADRTFDSISVGRFFLEHMLNDVAQRDREPMLRARVARENERSLALCSRIGMTEEHEAKDQRFVERCGRLDV